MLRFVHCQKRVYTEWETIERNNLPRERRRHLEEHQRTSTSPLRFWFFVSKRDLSNLRAISSLASPLRLDREQQRPWQCHARAALLRRALFERDEQS